MAAAQTTTAGALYGRLAVLGLALFVYLTAELFPIGALNDLAMGLHVAPATAGLLLTAHAIAAGAATLPAVWACRQLDRRRALTVSLVLLALSQHAERLLASPSRSARRGFPRFEAFDHVAQRPFAAAH
ncbi:hypothetical protein ACQP2U_19105 [Nocardia sp. CA-084685]|uniref:hypothetical protein n=1 Tax=Nocardia sp. CA-084685 TaxID=3239970 RepID=UPI003D981D35